MIVQRNVRQLIIRPMLLVCFFALLFQPVDSFSQPKQLEQKELTVDVLNHNESIDVRNPFSRNGDYVFTVIRGRNIGKDYPSYSFSDIERSDIIIRDAANKKIFETSFSNTRTSYFKPSWSPSGQHLAVLGRQEGTNTIHLTIWNRHSGKLERVSEGLMHSAEPLSWINDSVIIFRTIKKNGVNQTDQVHHTVIHQLPALFEKMKTGAASYGVIEHAPGVPHTIPGIFNIFRYNIFTREKTLLTPNNNSVPSLIIHAGTQSICMPLCFQYGTALLDTRKMIDSRMYGFTILDGRSGKQRYTSDSSLYVSPGSIIWSPDGRYISFTGFRYKESTNTSGLFLLDVSTGACKEIESEQYTGRQTGGIQAWWMGSHTLVLNGLEKQTQRKYWLSLNPGSFGITRLQIPDAAQLLCLGADQQTIYYTMQDNIFSLSANGSIKKELEIKDLKKRGIIQLKDKWTDAHTVALFIRSKSDKEASPLLLNLGAASIDTLKGLDSLCAPIYFNSRNNRLLYKKNTDEGNSLGYYNISKKIISGVYQSNTHLAFIKKNRIEAINYPGYNGDTLKGYLYFPVDYDAREQYPVVVQNYPGEIQQDKGNQTQILTASYNDNSFFNLQLFCAKGYFVFYPSIPLSGKKDPYLELGQGINSAVQYLLSRSDIDKNRLALIGHSYGGFGVCAAISQMSVFRAAIASAPATNLFLSYGVFPFMDKYGNDNLLVNTGFPFFWPELGQGKYYGQPWKTPLHYINNSPLMHADKINTPLLLLHGDMDDATNFAHSEQFFMALYRLNKKVRLVRFNGEAHILQSPGNIAQYWKEIFRWLEDTGVTPGPKLPVSDKKNNPGINPF